MRGIDALDIKPWMLPVIVVALVLPVAAAAILLGPVGAFAAGFLMAAALAVFAINARYDEEVEVAVSPDELHRALIVCLAPIEQRADAVRVAAEIKRDAEPFEGSARSLVLAPALNRPLAEWLSDVDRARADAQRRLDVTLDQLRWAGVDAEGQVGEDDIVQTVEDTLRSFPARDVIFVAGDANGAKEIDDLRRRLDRPIHELRLPTPTREGSAS